MGPGRDDLGHVDSALEACPPWVVGGHGFPKVADVFPCHGLSILKREHLEEVLREVLVQV